MPPQICDRYMCDKRRKTKKGGRKYKDWENIGFSGMNEYMRYARQHLYVFIRKTSILVGFNGMHDYLKSSLNGKIYMRPTYVQNFDFIR